MLGNESLRAAFKVGPSNDAMARAYLEWLRTTRRRTALTVYQYAAKLQSFLGWIGNCSLDKVTTEEIERWLNRPRSGRGAGRAGAPATISKEVSLLRGLYRYALAREWITSDPTGLLYAPTPKNVHPNPVPDDVWIPLWASQTLSDEARMVLGLGYFCGLRRAEIAALRGTHVQMSGLRLIGFTL